MVSCQMGPTRHAYAWQIGPFWQDTLDITNIYVQFHQMHAAFGVCVVFISDSIGTYAVDVAPMVKLSRYS